MAPTDMPKSWSVGLNDAPDREEKLEGKFEVRMTFDDADAARAWAKHILTLDELHRAVALPA